MDFIDSQVLPQSAHHMILLKYLLGLTFFLLIPSEEESKLAGIWDRLEQRLPAFEIETVKPFKEEDYR